MDRREKRWRREHIRKPKVEVIPLNLEVTHPKTGASQVVPESWATLEELLASHPAGASRDKIAFDVIEAVRLMITSDRAYDFGSAAENQAVSVFASWLASKHAYNYQGQIGAAFHKIAYSILMALGYEAFSNAVFLKTADLYGVMVGEAELRRMMAHFRGWAKRRGYIAPSCH